MSTLLSRVASAVCVMMLAGISYATPSLNVPTSSDDATFVVEVNWHSIETEHQKHIELYRNFEGGAFELIATGQSIQALSQVLLKNGVYGYKFRMVEAESAYESEPAFVAVDSPVLRYQLPKPKSRRAYTLGFN